jgi:DNA-binding MarR family transcriptional regulator
MVAGDPGELHDLLLDLVRSVGLLHLVDAGPGVPGSPSEIFALHELDANGGLAQQDLAHRLTLDKSTVSRLVAALERRGLVHQERDPANRRISRLHLTEAGRAVHAQIAAAFHHRHLEILADMTAQERAALSTGLTALLRTLHAARSQAPGRQFHPRASSG